MSNLRLVIGVGAAVILFIIAALTPPWIGSRQFVPPPPVEVSVIERTDSTITLNVSNRELHQLSGEAGYSVRSADGDRLYEAPPVRFTLAARGSTAITLPFPQNLPPGEAAIETWARERVATIESALIRSPLSVPISITPRAGMRVLSATLTREGDGYRLFTELELAIEDDETARAFRYAVELARVEPLDESRVVPVQRIVLSAFTPITLAPGERLTPTFTMTFDRSLAAGDYRVTLWVQAEDEDGAFQQFAQAAAPQLLQRVP